MAGGSTQNPKVPMFHPCLVLGDVGGALVFVGNGWKRGLFQGVINDKQAMEKYNNRHGNILLDV